MSRFEYRYYAIRRAGDQKPSVYCGEFDGPNCFEYGHYDSMAQARAVALWRNLRRGARGCGARAWYYTPGAIIVRWWERRKHPKMYLLVGEPGYGRTYGPGEYHRFGTHEYPEDAEQALVYEYDGRTLDGLLALRENAENIAMESGDKRPSDSLGVLPERLKASPDYPFLHVWPVSEPVERVKNFMVQAQSAERMERERQLGVDPDYACGAAYCDDPACRMHGKQAEQ